MGSSSSSPSQPPEFKQWTKNIQDNKKFNEKLYAAHKVISEHNALEAARQIIHDTKLLERVRFETKDQLTICSSNTNDEETYHKLCDKITSLAMAKVLSIDEKYVEWSKYGELVIVNKYN